MVRKKVTCSLCNNGIQCAERDIPNTKEGMGKQEREGEERERVILRWTKDFVPDESDNKHSFYSTKDFLPRHFIFFSDLASFLPLVLVWEFLKWWWWLWVWNHLEIYYSRYFSCYSVHLLRPYPHSSGFGPWSNKKKGISEHQIYTFNAQDKMKCSLSNFLQGSTVKGILLFRNAGIIL